ncbi:MAG: DUF615 domain-containing protein [Gammaproteobacteria bacterium]|nr:DUF615 domain-containing protein [Gammaproteobacteria bacterium]MBU1724890.1 DUF615 domain-containing protein [Gammaproteobacteria bacterium]MBU2004906.1 DUF615 domain-containing protein [Gammaproteobacteria bacterium]
MRQTTVWNTDEDYDDDDYISKSEVKREAEAMQKLGERLIELRQEQLEQLDLSEVLYDAVMLAKRLTAHGAIRRQKQYIGKLMRKEELEPIQAKFDEWDRATRSQAGKFHQLERWRERLLTDDDAVGELMQQFNGVDVQRLRTLIRNAHKEQSAGKPPKSSRELFKYLRELKSI